jgi:outer membrane protein assembly factor BamB
MAFIAIPALSTVNVNAQAPAKAEWLTGSADPARDAWQRGDSQFSSGTVKNTQLLWKLKVPIKTMGMQSFREPLILSGVQTSAGEKTVAILVGASNEVFAIDAASGTLLWQQKLKWAASQPQVEGEGRGFICTDAQTANPVATPVGSPMRTIYVLASDGYLHFIDASTGEESEQPIQVSQNPYFKPYSLNLVNNVIYTVSGQRCGGNSNSLYAVDLSTRKVAVSQPSQGGIFGVAGAAADSNGELYLATGDGPYDPAAQVLGTSFLGFTLANDTLTLKDYFTPSNYEWLTRRDLDMNATPVIFPYKGRDVMVGSGKVGRYYLIDTKNMGGPDHFTPLYTSPLFSNENANFQTEGTWGSLASWLDKDGTRWILAPTGGKTSVNFPISYGPTPHGGIIAMKLVERDGKPYLEPAWVSRDMITAEPPIIVNGVVFVLAAGEFTGQANDDQGGLYSANDRIERSVPAKLYALDAETGKVLYSSDDQITSFLHQAGPSTAGNKVIFGTFDGTIYCFGLKE